MSAREGGDCLQLTKDDYEVDGDLQVNYLFSFHQFNYIY